MLPARRWGDERRWHRAIVRRRSPHGRAPTAPQALGAQGMGEDSRVNVQHGMIAADPDGFNGGRSVVRLLPLALGLTLVLFHPLPAPLGVSFIGDAAAQSRDELYAKCRRAVFRGYGQPGVQYNRAPGRRVLPSKFVVGAIDQCVASGGRVI